VLYPPELRGRKKYSKLRYMFFLEPQEFSGWGFRSMNWHERTTAPMPKRSQLRRNAPETG
jgi:hypothetical protein